MQHQREMKLARDRPPKSPSNATYTKSAAPTATDRSIFEQRLAQAVQGSSKSLSPSLEGTRAMDGPTPSRNESGGGALSGEMSSPGKNGKRTLANRGLSSDTELNMSSDSHGEPTTSPLSFSGNVANDPSAYAHQIRTLRAMEKEVVHLRHTVRELSSQLHMAQAALDQRADAAAQLQQLRSKVDQEQVERQQELRNARLEMLEGRVKYRTMEERLADTYDADVHTKATELLENHTKEVHASNFELLADKIMLLQEVDKLRTEYKALDTRYRQLKCETNLDDSATRELLKKSVSNKEEIRALRRQVKLCEENLEAVVAQYDAKLAAAGRVQEESTRTLTRERDNARRDAVQLRRELEQLRAASHNVLSQRSELESFFYAALEEVRQGVVEERRQLLLDGTYPPRAADVKLLVPPQTNSSVLRLEGQELLLLKDAAGAGESSRAGGCWAVDRKGFPKRITAPTSGKPPAAITATAAASCSSTRRSLRTHSDNTTTAAPPLSFHDTPSEGTLVSVAQATPPYLRKVPEASPLPLIGSREVAVTAPVEPLRDAVCVGRLPFRLGTKSKENSTPALPTSSPAQPPPLPEMTVTEDFPLLHSLPTAPTWKDVKQVDVSELRWTDKERVIQLLFKRIRQEGHRHATRLRRGKEATPLADTKIDAIDTVEEHFSTDADGGEGCLTFVTQ